MDIGSKSSFSARGGSWRLCGAKAALGRRRGGWRKTETMGLPNLESNNQVVFYRRLTDDTHAALKYIGVNKEYEGTFPNIEMNTVPHLQLVQL